MEASRHDSSPVVKLSSPSPAVIISVVSIGLLIYLLLKRKSSSHSRESSLMAKPRSIGITARPAGTYSNAAKPAGTYRNTESWNVSYNEDGLPTKIEIHRDAVRS